MHLGRDDEPDGLRRTWAGPRRNLCRLDRGLKGKRLSDLTDSMLEAIKQPTT